MKKLILLTIILTFGCSKRVETTYQVICDGGFKTPISSYAATFNGTVEWREHFGGINHQRKMISGEICSTVELKTRGSK